MTTTNLVTQIQLRIDNLTGTESRKDLLTLKAAAEVDDSIDTTNLDTIIANNDATIDATTSDLELVTQSRSVVRYPWVEEPIVKQNYPYSFLTAPKESVNGFIGLGGSTWWTSPSIIGRTEGGKDVVYAGTVYEAPEDKSSSNFNKVKGEAIISLKRAEIETDPLGVQREYITYTERGLVENGGSYRCDEHHMCSVWHNKQNGQLITAWGSRNSAEPYEIREQQQIRYGKNLETLSTLESPKFEDTVNYTQFMGTGGNVYVWSRIGINEWWYSKGSGGQNYAPSTYPFFKAELDEQQYYLNQRWVDASETGALGAKPENNIVHCFGQGHPTKSPDGQLRYLHGELRQPGDPGEDPNALAGLYYTRPTSGEYAADDGKLGSMRTLDQNDFETAVQLAAGKSYRLLDVQYGMAPRALIAVFDHDWLFTDSVPLGKTYDLYVVQFNPWDKVWTNHLIKADIRGALGFRPWTVATSNDEPVEPPVMGIESYSGLYLFGACFYRGRNRNDLAPKVYLANRIGDDINTHNLVEITMSNDYTTVASETDITPLLLPPTLVDWNNVTDGIPAYKHGLQGSRDIIYRPETILGGNKRGLRVEVGKGWSTPESWSAETALIFREEESVAPIISFSNSDITASVGDTVTLGVTATSVDAGELTYVWEFQNAGGSWEVGSATDSNYELYVGASANGRMYRCTVTNHVGSTTSPEFTITVV